MTSIFVRCKVSLGNFDSEYFVMVADQSSAFVDRGNVKVDTVPGRGAEVEGKVLAYIVGEDDRKEKALVELPGQAVVGGLRTWIPRSLVASA